MTASLTLASGCDTAGQGPDPFAHCGGVPEVGCPCDDDPPHQLWRCCDDDEEGGALVCIRDIDAAQGDVTIWRRMYTCSCPPHDGLECDAERSQWRGCTSGWFGSD